MSVPVIKTELPGPNAKAIIDRDTTVVSPSYTRGYPLVIERGSGATVEDVDGNVFLDCAPGIDVNSTGHSHPDVVQAITTQAGKFLHMSGTDFYYEPQVRLAEELAAIVPIQGGVRSFFGNSGTEAIEACLKLSRYATGRQNIIAFIGGFHGRSMGSLALTASKALHRRRAGHDRDREGDYVGAAARRRRGARRVDGVAAWRAREHVRRQSGLVRCGAGHNRAAARAPRPECRGRRSAPDERIESARRE